MIKRKQRIPLRDLTTMAADDRETVEKNAMNGQIFNIFKVLAHHPKLVKRWTGRVRVRATRTHRPQGRDHRGRHRERQEGPDRRLGRA